MKRNLDLIGQTITGVVARRGGHGEPRIIYMLQLGDGTCVEFVTPDGARALRTAVQNQSSAGSGNAAMSPRQAGLQFGAL